MHLFQWHRWAEAVRTIPKLLVTLLIVSVGIVLISTQGIAGQLSPLPLPSLSQPDPLSPQIEQVKTGIFVVNIYDIDLKTSSFYADFYVWFKWKGSIDPVAALEVTNSISDWAMISVPSHPEPERLPDGSYYQISRVEGRFLQSFDLKRYPLDAHNLSIFMENSVYTAEQLVYVADQEQSGYSQSLTIPGWSIVGSTITSLVRTYNTSFGDPRLSKTSDHSVLCYSLSITRPGSFFVWKLLLPLLIVLASSWGALLLAPQHIDSRVALPVTALLTAVFLQETYADALPDLGYLVLMDKVYVIAYILIFSSTLEIIVTAYWVDRNKDIWTGRVMGADLILLGLQIVVMAIGLFWLVIQP
jgi:hypothetical protein